MSAQIPYSQLRDPNRPSLAARLPLAMPLAIYLELTNRCNFACKFCPESFDDYEQQTGGLFALDMPAIEKICSDIRAMGRLKTLRFYMMGEPMLSRNLAPAISLARDMGIADRLELTSNGTAINERRALELVNSGLDYLRISIYGMDEAKHRALTDAPISPKRIAEGVRLLRNIRDRIGSKSPFMYVKMIEPFDPKETKSFYETYRPIADECEIEPPMNWNGYDKRDILAAVYGDRAKDPNHGPKQVCPYPFYTLVIHSSGDVSVCCVDWNKKAVVGNVLRQSLSEIWNGEPLRAFQRMQIERRSHESEACRNCTYLHTAPDNLDNITDPASIGL